MSNSTSTSSGGFGLSTLLTIVFVTLKLCDKIDWSWVWVLCPLWISFGVWVVLMSLFVLAAVISQKR